jgi:hypothetical protein
MLAGRGDVRFAAVLIDPGMLGPAEALSKHRGRQRQLAESRVARTSEGTKRKAALLELLGNPALSDGEDAQMACLPRLLMAELQRTVGYHADDRVGRVTGRVRVEIDKERLPTVQYAEASVLPALGWGRQVLVALARELARIPYAPPARPRPA